jgi:hypothetical protein
VSFRTFILLLAGLPLLYVLSLPPVVILGFHAAGDLSSPGSLKVYRFFQAY